MSQIRYRLATEGDLSGLHRVFLAAVQDLDQRSGRPPVERPQEHYDWLRHHLMRHDGDGWWLAEDERGTVIGWSSAILREATWFLSGFWVRPEAQGLGIGRNLLQHSLEYGRGQYRVHFVYASDDPRALALYQRFGMVARFPVWSITGNPARLADFQLPADIVAQPISVATASDRQARLALDELDLRVRGARRPADHSLWLGYVGSGSFSGQLYWRGSQPIGYSYMSNWGMLGPVVAIKAGDFLPLLKHGLGLAARRGFGYLHCDLPSINAEAVRLLLDYRWRINNGHSFFLSSGPLGMMDRYIPSGATLF
jgi:GNAT superfamily N-acetyltransferase